MIRGCDVSHHQGEIDWLMLSTRGLDFAYIRSSYGADKPDTRFVYNWQAAKPVINRGLYHYYLAGDDNKEQLNLIKKQAAGDWGEYPAGLDLEWYSGDGANNEPSRVGNYLVRLTSMLDMIDDASGAYTAIYTRTNFVTTYLKQPSEDTIAFQLWASLGNRLLWLAQYANNVLAPFSQPSTVPLPWFDWWIHQFSADNNNMGHYYGCKGSHAIDLDRMKEIDDIPCPPVPPDPPDPPPVVQRWRVTVAKLNVRAEPSSTSKDVGDLFLNDTVDELDRFVTNDELWIKHSLGWSAARYYGQVYMVAI